MLVSDLPGQYRVFLAVISGVGAGTWKVFSWRKKSVLGARKVSMIMAGAIGRRAGRAGVGRVRSIGRF
jgi:hypothetical protein